MSNGPLHPSLTLPALKFQHRRGSLYGHTDHRGEQSVHVRLELALHPYNNFERTGFRFTLDETRDDNPSLVNGVVAKRVVFHLFPGRISELGLRGLAMDRSSYPEAGAFQILRHSGANQVEFVVDLQDDLDLLFSVCVWPFRPDMNLDEAGCLAPFGLREEHGLRRQENDDGKQE